MLITKTKIKKTEVQDLKCGNVFEFRKETYIALSNFTDTRHTQTIITALPNV